jgi:hypothetical protein
VTRDNMFHSLGETADFHATTHKTEFSQRVSLLFRRYYLSQASPLGKDPYGFFSDWS